MNNKVGINKCYRFMDMFIVQVLFIIIWYKIEYVRFYKEEFLKNFE